MSAYEHLYKLIDIKPNGRNTIRCIGVGLPASVFKCTNPLLVYIYKLKSFTNCV